ncbi:MAG: AraC family transcriptional regulator [Myxococcales bacterium]
MPTSSKHQAATLSVRFFWPFMRAVGADPRTMRIVLAEQLRYEDLTAADTRVPHSTVMRILRNSVAALNDPQLGLKAGLSVQPGDMDVLEMTARSCSTLREAADCVARYHRLMHDGAEVELLEENGVATWRYRLLGLEEPPAAHDFIIAYLKTFVQILTGRDEPLLSLQFAHEDRTNLAEYERLFRCPVTFGSEYTGCSFPARRLDSPMPGADRELQQLFEGQTAAKLRELDSESPLAELVRRALLRGMTTGAVEMNDIAQQLAMSESTLRRRLKDEGTTLSELLEDTRKVRAMELLARSELAAGEIAFLLRFSDPAAFYRAFKRWTGMTPSEYRASLK